MSETMNKTKWEEEFIMCGGCANNIRPIEMPCGEADEDDSVNDLLGRGFRTCPLCGSLVEKEIEEHTRKYDLEEPK